MTPDLSVHFGWQVRKPVALNKLINDATGDPRLWHGEYLIWLMKVYPRVHGQLQLVDEALAAAVQAPVELQFREYLRMMVAATHKEWQKVVAK